MRKWGEKIIGFFCNPRPTLFDIVAVVGVIGMGFVIEDLKGLYLIFYSITIVCLGFHQRLQRNIRASGLALIALCGLTNLFLHSFAIYYKSITFQYLNVYLMLEGFIYILFGSLLFYTLATKGNNLRLFAITLPIAALGWIKYGLHGGQISVFFALLVGFIVYLALQRRFILLHLLICLALCVIIFCPLKIGGNDTHLLGWMKMKFSLRPAAWMELYKLIWVHPFIGEGFNKFIGQDNNSIVLWNSTKTVVMNCLYRQNDYLNIAVLYGAPILIAIGVFIKEGFSRLRNSWMLAPFMAICILAFVQMTFFCPDKALVLLCTTATFYTET